MRYGYRTDVVSGQGRHWSMADYPTHPLDVEWFAVVPIKSVGNERFILNVFDTEMYLKVSGPHKVVSRQGICTGAEVVFLRDRKGNHLVVECGNNMDALVPVDPPTYAEWLGSQK